MEKLLKEGQSEQALKKTFFIRSGDEEKTWSEDFNVVIVVVVVVVVDDDDNDSVADNDVADADDRNMIPFASEYDTFESNVVYDDVDVVVVVVDDDDDDDDD